MFSKRLKLTTASKFCHRFGTGLKAGADMIRLLESEASHGAPNERQAMRLLAEGARRGDHLSSVMDQNSAYFPRLMAAMTRVGEATGRLERTLLALSEHFQRQISTRRMFISSITLPGLQLVGGIVVLSLLIYLMGILTPAGGGQMTDILGFGLRGGSGVLWFWLYVSIFFGTVGGFTWAFFNNVGGIQNLAPLIYLIPKIGPSIQTITISRFCWTMALSLDAGLDPLRAIPLALDSTDSDYYRSAADDAETAIRGGSTLAGALAATDLFPEDFIARVDIAEHSGTDAESMDYLAKEYDERARSAVKFLAGTATVIIRVAIILFFVFLIFRIAQTYLGALSGAMEPI
ncbi:Putative type II secretion system protein F [Rubripirellula lacrimiformis]|uniref:Type II secretion system protein F n=1 Tax=Rubripirellula lacrimiformis TaxID=1930273 RepID=A0A517NKQ1_9BACT|nr:type II secretion system F family protein [Rubripirellula lacrimiformis]QDT07623.1 Putative type II secretion system protein F [Rubripirellula lacrimiformis]